MGGKRPSGASAVDILHVPFTYFPDPPGGTETYTAALARGLGKFGLVSAIAAPAADDADYEHGGLQVFRYREAAWQTLANAYGEPDPEADAAFRQVLRRTRPRIVHLHARTAAVSVAQVAAAAEAGAKVVFTYHTPSVSCVRGSMMLMGKTGCDGKVLVHRCSACVLQHHGVVHPLNHLGAAIPPDVGDWLGRADLEGRLFTALRIPALVRDERRRLDLLFSDVDRIVAVCDWVARAIALNGAPPSKLVICRQGVDREASAPAPPRPEAGADLRIAYFGRLDRTKGVDILIRALRRIPRAPVRLDIFGVRQPGSERYVGWLEQAAAKDSRIAILPALAPDRIVAAMAGYDFVAIPSRWLETGPLVVLESFAAGTPVLGVRLGGVAELVTDEQDGALVLPHSPVAWANAIDALARDRPRAERLRRGVRPPRTMTDVAAEMAALYAELLRPAALVGVAG